MDSSRPILSLLIVLNGSLAGEGKTIGGGDLVLFKFIRLSAMQPDLLIPESAAGFALTHGRKFLTRRTGGSSLPAIVWLFWVRLLQAARHARRDSTVYDVALAASPFTVDVLPIGWWKARHKGAVIYHVIPERKAVNFTTRLRFMLAAFEQKIAMAAIRRTCDFIVAGNEFTKQQLTERMPGKPIFILPAGFDAARIDREPAEAKDPNLAVFVGRMVSQKGIFDLLKCMTEIARTHPDLQLVMVGTGPERDYFVAELKRLQLRNVRLSGFLSESEKIRLLKRAGYFFFPSYEEGWGIALAEALYCECRCICYELPHYRSIFGDFPAYARLGDPTDFVRAFREADPVSAAQKEFMRQYDDPVVARQLAAHLEAVAGLAAVPAR